jgi:hypothetical protein
VSHSSPSIDPIRVAQHIDFFKQVKGHLDNHKIREKQWVHVLINKNDLWSLADKTEQEQLIRTFTDEVESWKNQRRTHTAECQPHSNKVANDIRDFGTLLKKH